MLELLWVLGIVVVFVLAMGKECSKCEVPMSLDGKSVLGYSDGISNGHLPSCPYYRRIS